MTECQDVLLSREEIYRAERLEMLDEREEFNLIQSHYGVSVARSGRLFRAKVSALVDAFLVIFSLFLCKTL